MLGDEELKFNDGKLATKEWHSMNERESEEAEVLVQWCRFIGSIGTAQNLACEDPKIGCKQSLSENQIQVASHTRMSNRLAVPLVAHTVQLGTRGLSPLAADDVADPRVPHH